MKGNDWNLEITAPPELHKPIQELFDAITWKLKHFGKSIDIDDGWDTISRKMAIDAMNELTKWSDATSAVCLDYSDVISVLSDTEKLPSAQPEIIRCKDCKHNPKYEWFACPMSHLSEKQRPETAWCWKAERRSDG